MSGRLVTIFDIGFTYGIDGPGQRMVVYLKGCNMHCPWCASPESIESRTEVLFYPERSQPGVLAEACPHGAVSLENGTASRDISKCSHCERFRCVESHVRAFELCGFETSVERIVDQAVEYRPFFGDDGGVTIGGGEPSCQYQPLREILSRLNNLGVNTAVETNGTHPRLRELFPLLDTLMIDLKHPLSSTCAATVGQGNEITLANIEARFAEGGKMIVRIPLIPAYNSDEETLRQYGEVLGRIGPLDVEILPFHRRGEVKWQARGLKMPAHEVREPSRELLSQAAGILEHHGLMVL